MRVYNKLVRDNIPKIIADNGEKANTYILDDEQYIIELKKKLREEVNEYFESDELVELADIFDFENELHSEIEKIVITDNLVDNWTYPLIQPELIKEAERRGFI